MARYNAVPAPPPVEVHNLFILDRSGSMSSCWAETVSGLNENFNVTRKIQEKHPEQTNYSHFVIFDDEIDEVFVDKLPDEVRNLGPHDYSPRGSTALYDAVAQSVLRLEAKLEGRENTRILVTILTDGYENASTEFTTYGAVKEILKRLEATKRWTFTFMGASDEIIAQAKAMGFSGSNALNYTKLGGVSKGMEGFTRSRTAYAATASMSLDDAAYQTATMAFFGDDASDAEAPTTLTVTDPNL
jgi:hypothetical protein